MPSVDVRNLENAQVGTLELSEAVFGAPLNKNLLYEAVRNYLNSRRAGTHATKVRSMVAGSGRKLWKQKGTGRARIGSVRSPLWRHGGTVHGPQPRSYAYKLPRKMLLGALRSALSAKVADQQMTVVDSFQLENHKTQGLRNILDRFEAERSVLLVDLPGNQNLERSSKNLEGVELLSSRELHPYHLLKYERVIISQPAVEKLQEALQP
ncbi:MAG: 50S ribosomal protein L4 [Acidobacteria bacterium]|nr:50S ribosomal protein L4 [Acidobacteriota bacterium]